MENKISRMVFSMTNKSIMVSAQLGSKINLKQDGWNLVSEFEVKDEEHYNAIVKLGKRICSTSVPKANHVEIIVDFNSGFVAINITKDDGKLDLIVNVNQVMEYETIMFTGRGAAQMISINMSKDELMNMVRAMHECFLTPID